jgi:hypothetical protein
MKSKLSMKLLGIVVTIATISSLLVGITAAPLSVSAAPGTLNYGSVSTPGNANNVLGGTMYLGGVPANGFAITSTPRVDLIASTTDGSTMFAWDDNAKMLYTSTNAAVSWTPRPFTGTDLSGIGHVIKILVSPNYNAATSPDSTVVLVCPTLIYVSTNGGLTFTASSPPTLNGTNSYIISADIGQYYSDGGVVSVLIGICGGNTSSGVSDVQRLKLPSLYPWMPIGSIPNNCSVFGVAFSKSHATDAEILAVVDSAPGVPGTGIPTLESRFAEGTFGNNLALSANQGGLGTLNCVNIAMGTDYNGFGASNTLAIGFDAGDLANVYRVTGRTNSLPGNVIDCEVQGGSSVTNIESIVINGTSATGTVLVGFTNTVPTPHTAQVYSATTFSAGPTVTFVPAADPPTGTAITYSPVPDGCVVLWVGTTVFAATTGPDGGISSSTDNGVHFNQLSLISVGTASAGTIDCMSIVSLQAVDANNMFLIMADSNGSITTGQSARQLWITANGGTSWTRVLTSLNMGLGNTSSIAFVAPSPAYATDHTFYVSQGTLGITNTVLMSTNSGMSFNLSISSAQQSAVMFKNSTLYYGGGGSGPSFYKLMRFSPASFPAGDAGTVSSIAFSPTDTTGATIAVGTTSGNVYLSTNDGVSFTKLGTVTASANAYVAYGPDGSLYAATAAKIVRWVVSTASFLQIDGAQGATGISGLAVTPDGTLYASDNVVNGTAYNDVWRSLYPTTGSVTSTGNFCAFQAVPSSNGPTDSFTAGPSAYLFSGISIVSTAASNTLYLVDTNNNGLGAGTTSGTSSGYKTSLKAFIDTFIVGPALTSPANGALLTTQTSPALSWTAMTGASVYQIGVNDASGFTGNDFSGDTGAAGSTNLSNPASSTPTTFTNKGNANFQITAGGTYYWRVRATNVVNGAYTGALYSRYSTPTWSFITALAPPGVTTIQNPTQGATGVDVNTTFTWPASNVPGATYQFVIAEELGNVDKFAIIDYSATCPTNATALRETLKYDTTYWWRVRTVTATSQSDWTVAFFTTEPEPAAVTTTPTTPVVTPIISVVVPTQPAVTPTIINSGTSAPTTPVIPTYLLWAVIVVGAVLVIAVIVLIVRTRRIP